MLQTPTQIGIHTIYYDAASSFFIFEYRGTLLIPRRQPNNRKKRQKWIINQNMEIIKIFVVDIFYKTEIYYYLELEKAWIRGNVYSRATDKMYVFSR